jgi:hypothetical protein
MINQIFFLGEDSTVFQVIGDVSLHPLKAVSNFIHSSGPCVRIMSCKKTKILYDGPNGIHTVWHQHYGKEFDDNQCVEFSLEGINFVNRLQKNNGNRVHRVRHPIVPIPMAGLFVCQWVALGMHLRKDLTPVDKVALPFTKQAMFKIGMNNPSFVLSPDLMKAVLSIK